MQLPGGAGLHHQRVTAVHLFAQFNTVRADLAYNNAYWASFAGAAADASQTVYDTILKGYGQADGIRSYGMVVDLLVAYYRDTALGADR